MSHQSPGGHIIAVRVFARWPHLTSLLLVSHTTNGGPLTHISPTRSRPQVRPSRDLSNPLIIFIHGNFINCEFKKILKMGVYRLHLF